MPRITLYLKDAEIRSEVSGILTSGMAGVEVNLICDDSWDGLLKTLVCRAGDIAKSVLVKNDRAVVAHEALVEGKWLELGVEGRNEDGSVVIPTLWERCCIVMPGTDAQADPTADPTLPIWGQLQKRVEALEIPPIPVEIGALPGPMGAKIGQFFRVADVNQIGAVVAVEAVDMPSGGGYALPLATADTLGGVKAEPATDGDTQPVRIGEDGMLYTAPGGGGGEKWRLINSVVTEEDVSSLSVSEDLEGKPFSLKKVKAFIRIRGNTSGAASWIRLTVNNKKPEYVVALTGAFAVSDGNDYYNQNRADISVHDGYVWCDLYLRSQNNAASKDTLQYAQWTGQAYGPEVDFEKIESVDVYSAGAGIGAGTEMVIWGVDAQ